MGDPNWRGYQHAARIGLALFALCSVVVAAAGIGRGGLALLVGLAGAATVCILVMKRLPSLVHLVLVAAAPLFFRIVNSDRPIIFNRVTRHCSGTGSTEAG